MIQTSDGRYDGMFFPVWFMGQFNSENSALWLRLRMAGAGFSGTREYLRRLS